MAFQERLAKVAARVEERLAALLSDSLSGRTPPRLRDAVRHAVLGGGKRLRPFLTVEAAGLFGILPEQALDAAAAVECLHCYSLVHDDLPAMDNDELRRGQLTVWKAFDVPTAILAGDALQSLAFDILARPRTHADAAVRAELILGLAQASGAIGMAGGQQLDLEAERGLSPDLHSAAGVTMIQQMKTGALIRFSVVAGAILGCADVAARKALADYGDALGAAFQVADDLLDAEGDITTAGKRVGKDVQAGKATSVTFGGVAGARARLSALEGQAVAALVSFGGAADPLREAAVFVGERSRQKR